MTDGGQLASSLVEELDLLGRHILMLKATRENEPIGIMRLSEILGIPSHRVRYSLRILEKEGLIEPTPGGAKTTDLYEEYMGRLAELLDSLIPRIEGMRVEITQNEKE